MPSKDHTYTGLAFYFGLLHLHERLAQKIPPDRRTHPAAIHRFEGAMRRIMSEDDPPDSAGKMRGLIAILDRFQESDLGEYYADLEATGIRGLSHLVRSQKWGDVLILLEKTIHGAKTSSRLSTLRALHEKLIHRIDVDELKIEFERQLATILYKMDEKREAKTILVGLIPRFEERRKFKAATAMAFQLIQLLMIEGSLKEAMDLCTKKIELTERAGLGPWTRLDDEARRLQVVVAMGRAEEALERFTSLHTGMGELPEQGEVEEAAEPWRVREALLEVGVLAANRAGHWNLRSGNRGSPSGPLGARCAMPTEPRIPRSVLSRTTICLCTCLRRVRRGTRHSPTRWPPG